MGQSWNRHKMAGCDGGRWVWEVRTPSRTPSRRTLSAVCTRLRQQSAHVMSCRPLFPSTLHLHSRVVQQIPWGSGVQLCQDVIRTGEIYWKKCSSSSTGLTYDDHMILFAAKAFRIRRGLHYFQSRLRYSR